MIVSSWFWFYTGSRTLANTVETALTSIALSYFPWQSGKRIRTQRFQRPLTFPLCCMLRIRQFSLVRCLGMLYTTNCCYHMASVMFPSYQNVSVISCEKYLSKVSSHRTCCWCSISCNRLRCSWQSNIHTNWVFESKRIAGNWKFLRRLTVVGAKGWNNHTSSSLVWYHFRYWYVIVGLPAILGLSTLPFLLATAETLLHRSAFPDRVVLLCSIVFTLAIYSLLPHKEFRFILPILPMCIFITSDYLSRWSRKANR